MPNEYDYGRKKENLVAKRLRSAGAKVKLSRGSRGSADLKANFPTKKWQVQVKSSRTDEPTIPSKKELANLKRAADRSGATPVVAKVRGNKVQYTSARNGRKLKP